MIIFVGAVLLAFVGPSAAATVNPKAELKASNEVPPNDSKGPGSVAITFNEATKKLTLKVSFANLTGPATAAHFHGLAPAGKDASIVVYSYINREFSLTHPSASLSRPDPQLPNRYPLRSTTPTGAIRGSIDRKRTPARAP